MSRTVNAEHLEVLQTMVDAGLLTRQACKSIRGQVLSLGSHAEREAYLRQEIRNTTGRTQRRRTKGA